MIYVTWENASINIKKNIVEGITTMPFAQEEIESLFEKYNVRIDVSNYSSPFISWINTKFWKDISLLIFEKSLINS